MFSHPHDYNYTSAQATFVRVGRCIVVYNPIKTSLKLQRGNQNLKPGGGGGGGGVNTGASEGFAVHAPHVTLVVLLLNDTNVTDIIWKSCWALVYVK